MACLLKSMSCAHCISIFCVFPLRIDYIGDFDKLMLYK